MSNAAMVAFVQARLDDAERDALAATSGPWQADGGSVYVGHPVNEVVSYTESAAHIAHQDPDRTLREIAAKRTTLDAYAAVADMDTPGAGYDYPHGRAAGLGLAVRQMAAVHAGHPDYQAAWAEAFTS